MTDDLTQAQIESGGLPTFEEKISAWFGFKIKLPHLPQTLKNIDKALSRLVVASSEWMASFPERDTAIRHAQTKVDEALIEAAGKRLIADFDVDGVIAERALDYMLRESILGQRNREKIARLAIQHVAEKVENDPVDATDEIDEDWLNEFSALAAKKSNSDIQSLWARILSGKIRNKTSFSVQSLQLLSALDTRDANLIHKVISLSINASFIFRAKEVINIDEVLVCEELGVITSESGQLRITFKDEAGTYRLFTLGKENLLGYCEDKVEFSIPILKLTRFGSELYYLLDDINIDTEYRRSFIDFIRTKYSKVGRTDTLEQNSDSLQCAYFQDI